MQKNEIYRSYGTDFKEMTKRLLSQAGLAERLPDPAARIAVKPNLVSPTPASFGGTTHPEVVAGIIEFLQDHGYKNIVIAEGSWVGDKTAEAFEYCGYNDLAVQYGVELIDTQKEKGVKVACGAAGSGSPDLDAAADFAGETLHICACVRDWDYLINVPVLKGHCQTNITCALKNLKGLIPNSEKRRFHTMGLHRPIALLNTVIKPDFIVIDHICGDLAFEDGGNPVIRNCVMAAVDPVLVDAYVCFLLDYETDDVEYVGLAERLGCGNADLSSLRLITVEGDPGEDVPSRARLDVCDAVDDVDSCSACYAALVPVLERLRDEGLLDKLPGRIGIGQGHRGKSGEIGIGNCTSGFDICIKGCPPDEEDIYKALKGML